METIEGQEIYKKRGNEDDPRRRRSQERKIGNPRMNGRR